MEAPTVRQRWQAAIPMGILLVGALLPLPEAQSRLLLGLPTFCGLHRLTGIPCPACGLTRSVVCLMHGQLALSFWFHPLGVPLVIALCVWAYSAWRGVSLPPKAMHLLLPLTIAVLFLVWGVRLLGWLPLV